MDLNEFYRSNASRYSGILRKQKRKRNFITFLKLTAFVWAVYTVVLAVSRENAGALYRLLPPSVLFVLSALWDARVYGKIKSCKALIAVQMMEIEALAGNTAAFDGGGEYADPAHPYTSDLDIFGDDSVFKILNRTVTPEGKKQLADFMRYPAREKRIICERQEAAGELMGNMEWCHRFRARGMPESPSEISGDKIDKWVLHTGFFGKSLLRLTVYVLNILSLLLWVAAFASVLPYSFAIVLFLIQLGIVGGCSARINRVHRGADGMLASLASYSRLIDVVNTSSFRSVLLLRQLEVIGRKKEGPEALRYLEKLRTRLDQRGNIMALFVLNGLFMNDLHSCFSLCKWQGKYARNILSWVEAVGCFDAVASMANLRFNRPDYCVPEIADEGCMLEMRSGIHPLLSHKAVANDFELSDFHRISIVTGANMAGKSTFLRTVGVNMVLALSGNAVRASHFRCMPVGIFTSMRTTDNLVEGVSYFHAELLRLKVLLEMADEGNPVFFIIDEMLKGTNSVDKVKGSRLFLMRLLSLPVSGLLATHDLSLGNMETEDPVHFSNFCFEIEHCGEEIRYDYILRRGISRNMNASLLLESMGLIG